MTPKLQKAFIDKNYHVEFVDYDGKNYFNLISQQSELSKRQVIINSKLILRLAEFLFNSKGFNLIEINLANDEDDTYVDKINKRAIDINENREYFDLFKQELEYFCTEDSIEISEISFKDKGSIVTLKSNGIVKIIGKIDDQIIKELEEMLGNYFYEANR